jgi:membrane protein
VEPDQPTDAPADEPNTPARPAASITQPPPVWKKVLDRGLNRVMQNVVVRTTFAVMDTAGQAGAPLFAAALAFTTLFAVVPLLLLVAGLLGWLIQDEIQRSTLLEQLVSYFPPLADVMATSLESVVRERGALSLIGLVGLVWGSSSYYAALDEVMRRIFTAEHARGFISQRLRGIITVVVLVGLMLGTIILSSIFALLSERVGDFALLRLATPLVALSIMAVVVLCVYLLVPAAPPSWRAALPPAVAAGIGIGALTSLFSILTPWLLGGLLAFGVIATVFGALIWLSFSYQILLYGAAWARIRRDAEVRRGRAAAAGTPFAS